MTVCNQSKNLLLETVAETSTTQTELSCQMQETLHKVKNDSKKCVSIGKNKCLKILSKKNEQTVW